jgi:hypothetical protein
MTNNIELSQSVKPANQAEFAKVEIEQAMETFRVFMSLMIQMITLLALADVTIVGYAVSTQISGILLIGALFPVLVVFVLNRVSRLTFPPIYTAVSLEQKYGGDSSDWLASTLLANTISAEYIEKLKKISVIQDNTERIKQLRSVAQPLVGSSKGLTRGVLILVAIAQVLAPIVLTAFFKWRLF